jgi:hypothetical protein
MSKLASLSAFAIILGTTLNASADNTICTVTAVSERPNTHWPLVQCSNGTSGTFTPADAFIAGRFQALATAALLSGKGLYLEWVSCPNNVCQLTAWQLLR